MKNSFFRRLLRYMKGYVRPFVLSLVFSAVFVVASLVLPVLFGKATDVIVGKDAVDFARLGGLGIAAVLCALAAGVSQWFTAVLCNRIANGVTRIHLYTMNKPDVAKAIFDNLSCILKEETPC